MNFSGSNSLDEFSKGGRIELQRLDPGLIDNTQCIVSHHYSSEIESLERSWTNVGTKPANKCARITRSDTYFLLY